MTVLGFVSAPAEKPNYERPKPTLRDLSALLRNRAAWPSGFEWDFEHCRTCAMGLANRAFSLGYEDHSIRSMIGAFMGHFNLSEQDAEDLFLLNKGSSYRKTFMGIPIPFVEADFADVTPNKVAAAIDRYLARAEAA